MLSLEPLTASLRNKSLRSAVALLIIGYLGGAVAGCASWQGSPLRGELANRGPISLSEQNPYLATNQLLAQEVKNSPELRGFLQQEGAPDAIQIQRPWLGKDEVVFYYIDQGQSYTLHEASSGWIIRGPERFSDALAQQLSTYPPIRGRAALLTDGASLDLPESVRVVTPNPAHNLKKPSEKMREKKEGKAGKLKQAKSGKNVQRKAVAAPDTSSEPHPGNATPSATLELPVSTQPANLPPAAASESSSEFAGDLIHQVSHPGETLHTIANWYTGDPTNAARIAGINGIADVNLLSMGSSVRVPRYLLKRDTPLPASEVRK